MKTSDHPEFYDQAIAEFLESQQGEEYQPPQDLSWMA